MKVSLTIEIELDNSFLPMDGEEKKWLEESILSDTGTLILHSNEIGDTVGIVTSVKNIEWK